MEKYIIEKGIGIYFTDDLCIAATLIFRGFKMTIRTEMNRQKLLKLKKQIPSLQDLFHCRETFYVFEDSTDLRDTIARFQARREKIRRIREEIARETTTGKT